MKTWKVVLIMWLWVIAMLWTIKHSEADYNRKIEILNNNTKAQAIITQRQIDRIDSKVYEHETWLANMQVDFWDLQYQVDAMNLRMR